MDTHLCQWDLGQNIIPMGFPSNSVKSLTASLMNSFPLLGASFVKLSAIGKSLIRPFQSHRKCDLAMNFENFNFI